MSLPRHRKLQVFEVPVVPSFDRYARCTSAGASIDDQSRIATPAGAFKNGSSHIVVGRPITKAEDKIAAAQSIVAEIRGV